jgi:hypothetical protein
MLSRMLNTITSRRFFAALGLVAIAGIGTFKLAAQAPAGGSREKLTFLALGADGQPMAELQAAQIELKIDGKPRPVQAVRAVRIGGAAPAAAAAPKGMFDSSIPAPYGMNSAIPSRNVMIAVDEESMRPGGDKAIKDALDAFVGTLASVDQVGLVTMPRGATNVPFTTAKSNVRDAIAKVSGRYSSSASETCHTKDVTDALMSLMRSFGEGPTTVVFVSTGLASPSGSSGGTCDFTPSDLERLGKAAAAGRATAYVVLGEANTANQMVGLQNFAGALGSSVMNLSAPDPPFTRILRESGNYYVVEFDAADAERDGRQHRVDLKLTAPGSVRVVNEVTFSKATSAKPTAKDLVKETKIYTDLPMRAAGVVSRGTGEKIKVIALLEPIDPSVKFASAAVGLVSLADTSGKMVSATLNAEDLAKPFIAAAFEVPPGAYRLHVAAVDANGRAGSVDYPIDAQLTPSGTMKMSGLSLGVLGPPMVLKMEFSAETDVLAFFELYGTTQSPVSASIELAETPDGPAIVTGKPELSKTTLADAFTCMALLDIKALKPGDYVVRATFAIEGNPPGKVFRTLRKVAK